MNRFNSNQNTNFSNNLKSHLNLAPNSPVVTNESIKLIAESIGISNLNDEACKELSFDLTYTVKYLLLEAQKFSRKSRRKNLTSCDIDFSLKAHSIEPIYGFCSNDLIPFRCSTGAGGNGGRCLFYLDDQVLDLNELISLNNSTIKLPNDFVINAHWLAIEGIQPSLPENPQLISRDTQKKEAIEGITPSNMKDKHVDITQKKNIGENLIKLKSIVPHDLSIEQQFYFKEITEACVGSDEQKRTEALNSLSIDPSLHQLLPRFILFISEGVRLNIMQTNMAILIYLMRMAKSLIENKSIYLEKYLHELLPCIFSCILSKQLCSRPEIDNHYALREYCARLIGQVLKTYGPTLTFLQTRIIKVYLNSLQSEKISFSTLFGAIVGISELGDDIYEIIIFPLIKKLGEQLAALLDKSVTNQEKISAEKVKQELINFSNDELDYLTTRFGAFMGQLIHIQLLKLRDHNFSNTKSQYFNSCNIKKTIIPQRVTENIVSARFENSIQNLISTSSVHDRSDNLNKSNTVNCINANNSSSENDLKSDILNNTNLKTKTPEFENLSFSIKNSGFLIKGKNNN